MLYFLKIRKNNNNKQCNFFLSLYFIRSIASKDYLSQHKNDILLLQLIHHNRYCDRPILFCNIELCHNVRIDLVVCYTASNNLLSYNLYLKNLNWVKLRMKYCIRNYTCQTCWLINVSLDTFHNTLWAIPPTIAITPQGAVSFRTKKTTIRLMVSTAYWLCKTYSFVWLKISYIIIREW